MKRCENPIVAFGMRFRALDTDQRPEARMRLVCATARGALKRERDASFDAGALALHGSLLEPGSRALRADCLARSHLRVIEKPMLSVRVERCLHVQGVTREHSTSPGSVAAAPLRLCYACRS